MLYNYKMTATAHALVAAAIASKVHDPVLSTALAFASHFIMDIIPHWDVGTNWRTRTKLTTGLYAIAETLLGITVSYFLFMGKVPSGQLGLAIFASLLPDWLETPWYIFFVSHDKSHPTLHASFIEKLTYWIYKLENTFHTKAQFPFGFLTQIVTVGFFLVLLK